VRFAHRLGNRVNSPGCLLEAQQRRAQRLDAVAGFPTNLPTKADVSSGFI
jgi:hypothetical protein